MASHRKPYHTQYSSLQHAMQWSCYIPAIHIDTTKQTERLVQNTEFRNVVIPNVPQKNMDGILTQWAFHRVQEHPKRSSDEEVMAYRSLRSHVVRPSRAELTWPSCPDLSKLGMTPTILHRHTNGLFTQWAFHRVQEHPKRSSDEEVMTFRSWRSYVVKPSRAYLTWLS